MIDIQNTQEEVFTEEVKPVEAQEVVQEQPQQLQENAQAKNFRALREKAERAERERDEAIRVAKELQARMQPAIQESEDDINVAPDAYIEGKHFSKVAKELKQLKQQVHNYQQRSSMEVAEARLKAQHPDFFKVVNQDTIDTLKAIHPEIAQTLAASTNDEYSKALSAYTLIKGLGIYKEDTYQADRELAQKNAVKPRPLASVSPQQGDSPLSHANAFANGLTEDVKKQLYKEMMEYRKNI